MGETQETCVAHTEMAENLTLNLKYQLKIKEDVDHDGG